ncbi:TRAF-type zinc finger domain-containing protein 1-like [Littorina saxatilis]|uniref:TRAF-type domain-containing protein n=1 Tax=Littorina saxatilis TaxID=31220 RepID=A0AAN9AIV3_9CAEN
MSSGTAIETKYCSNCKKDIAAANFTMHEVHCRRHLVLCDHCKEPVPRTELDQHFNDVHAKIACTQCTQEVEKDQLDGHLENECSKRQVSCEYCELQVPHSDLAPHVEFCGTRTEACPRCGGFIMHKDLERHNDSNCAYPEVKPPTNTTNGFRDRGGGDDNMFNPHLREFGRPRHTGFGVMYQDLDDSFDPFEFEAIRRALEGDSEGRGMPGGVDEGRVMPSAVVTDSDASAAAGERERGRRGRGARGGTGRNAPVIPGQKKNDTGGGTRKAATNRRSEVNRHRERASSPPPIPPDVDYDTMLAMQLAGENDDNIHEILNIDPDPDADLNQLISNYEKRSRPLSIRPIPMDLDNDASVPSSPPPAYNEFAAADEDMIPCEFCGDNFPAFALVHHQSVCDPLASGLWGQDVPPAAGRNNETLFENEWTPAVVRPPAIPVINNLGSAFPAEEPEEELSYHLTDNGDHMLNSLENIMLPCEFCNELLPADCLVQHQAMCESNPLATPRVLTPAAAQPSSATSPTTVRNHFFPTAQPSSRRPQPDPTEALWNVIMGAEQENEGGNIRPKKRPNAPRPTNPIDAASGRPGNSTRPGASRVLQARGGSGRAAEEEQDFSLHNPRGSRPVRKDSANRTRHTLDALLTDEGTDNQGSQGSGRRPANRGAPATTSGVSTRTVMRSMQQRDDSTREGEADTSNRRERGDHLFNSQGNLRNPATQNRPRRPSKRQQPE